MSTSTKLDKDENGKPVNEKMYRGRSKRLHSGAGLSEPQPDFNMQLFTNRVNEGNWAAAGWTEIMTVSNIVYPKLVWYFYCNLDVDRNADEYTLVSRVKGVDFVLDVSTMSSFLKRPVVERGHIGDDEERNPQVNNAQGQEDITCQQDEHLAQLQNSRFDRVEHRMDHIDQAQQHYFSHYHWQYPDFVPYLDFVPYAPSPPPQ
ncbi:hypothetical protein RHSIM_Rhsim01G0072200 [Rhododendron simsii]|uniref:Uncharacterized protein n=1 Tax=Rhododendron simsii TaxID=118357 RepID=A0A834LWH9_RHOSS|nr:hypothetical protein RHSIM_Rhsim01G0072200 [Rhododendron simsii]